MPQAARLLDLVQALRGRRQPVAAAALAEELGVSPETVDRDVVMLVGLGAEIERSERGYVLPPGFFLPPLAFDADEIDAVILGLRLVAEREDDELGEAAEAALAKIAAVLPDEIEDEAPTAPAEGSPPLAAIQTAIRREERLLLSYVDKKGRASERVVWPVATDDFAAAEILAAWCETRGAFRHFRLDRIRSAQPTGERYPARRRLLLAEWRLSEEFG